MERRRQVTRTADAPYLQYITKEHLVEIRQWSNIDISGLKTKQEIVDMIKLFLTFIDEIEVSAATPSAETKVRKMKLSNVQPFDNSRSTITGWLDGFERACLNQNFPDQRDWTKLIDAFLTGPGQSIRKCVGRGEKRLDESTGKDSESIQCE